MLKPMNISQYIAEWIRTRIAKVMDDYKKAPPVARPIDVTYIPLYKKETGSSVGCFIPEFYELAKIGALRDQIEEIEWARNKGGRRPHDSLYQAKLHRKKPKLFARLYIAEQSEDGDLVAIPKTPFELALLPFTHEETIARYIRQEYRYRLENQLPLPLMVSRFWAIPDYLDNISEAGLAAGTDLNGFGKAIRLSLPNPIERASHRERIIHYLSQWTSWLLTITAAMSMRSLVIAMRFSSPLAMAMVTLSAYLTKKGLNDATWFETAEEIWRLTGAFSSPSPYIERKPIWRKFYLLLIGVSVSAVGYFTWSSALGLNLNFFSGATLEIAQIITAGFLAVSAASATLLAIIMATYLVKKMLNGSPWLNKAQDIWHLTGSYYPQFYMGHKLDWRKSISSFVHLTAVGISVYFAGCLAWSGALELELFHLFSGTALEVAQMITAGFFSFSAATSTLIGSLFAIRFFKGLSFWDNQVEVKRTVVDRLPTVKNSFERKLADALQVVHKRKYGVDEETQVKFEELSKEIFSQYRLERLRALPIPTQPQVINSSWQPNKKRKMEK